MNYDRQETIKRLLNENNIVYLKDLEKLFPDVSSMTLRRDIEKLEFQGIAQKIRGGAKRTVFDSSSAHEPAYSHRATVNMDIKTRLARNAVKFIESGRAVFLDSGTTTMELAKLLPDIKLSILTTGPNIAIEASKRYSTTVNMVGGTINSNNCAVSGMQALSFIKSINIDIAFTTPSGYSQSGGFTVGNYADCEVKRAIIKKANKVVMLMSSDKLDKSLPFTFATLKDIDVLITDGVLEESILKTAERSGIEIIRV
ncbi:MAG: DeoR/GlpR transcriptional regulator [Ruminococcaceae bacterium]|nr:DeoR/GlpR transcriptional regulator [Oscillospiraceae bacterium]